MNEFVINFKKSHLLIGDFVKNYNSKFTRKNDKAAIKLQHIVFIYKLLDCLSVQLNKAVKHKQNPAHRPTLCLRHYKKYYTTSKENRLNVSTRTISNYIKHLADAGVILNESTGSRMAIFLHPDLIRFDDKYEVLITCSLSQIFDLNWENLQKMKCADIQSLFSKRVKKLPAKQPTGNLKKSLDSVVENPHHGNTAQVQTGSTENTAVDAKVLETVLLETRKAAEKNGENQTPRPKNLREYSELRRAANQNKQRASVVNQMVVFLWAFVIENFYRPKYQYFDAGQEQIVLNFFHDQFATTPTHRLSEVYESLHKRNKKWLKFLKADPDRFTPLPGKFFDLNNAHGYNITKKWIQKDEIKHTWYQVQNDIDVLQRKAQKIVSGNHTEKGFYLTAVQKIEQLNQISDQVMRLALKHNRPDLKVQFGNKLQAFIDRHSPSIL